MVHEAFAIALDGYKPLSQSIPCQVLVTEGWRDVVSEFSIPIEVDQEGVGYVRFTDASTGEVIEDTPLADLCVHNVLHKGETLHLTPGRH